MQFTNRDMECIMQLESKIADGGIIMNQQNIDMKKIKNEYVLIALSKSL